jgi:hypothetical protein
MSREKWKERIRGIREHLIGHHIKDFDDIVARLRALEEFYELVRQEQASFQRWTLDIPKSVFDKLRALEEGGEG